MLELGGHGKEAEDDGPDEHVVHGQGLLDDVSGEVLLPVLGAPHLPHDGAERDTERHPDTGPNGRFPDTDGVGAAVGEQVNGQHGHDEGHDGGPCPEGYIHEKLLRSV